MVNFNDNCIIDDDLFFVFYSKKLIIETELGNSVLTFKNGKQAIDAFTEMAVKSVKFPDIVFLDINMPQLNGWKFLDAFLELSEDNWANTNVYITSSFFSPSDIEKSKKFCIVKGCITKPITPEILQAIGIKNNNTNLVIQEKNLQEQFVEY